MSHFVFVHGAWGDVWEFEPLRRSLSGSGHAITVIDLPGHGQDTTEVGEVTMAAYVDRVVEEIERIDERVVLLGHSLAGWVVAQVSERISSRIETVVFLSAFLPADGDSPLGLMERDPGGKLLSRIVFSEDQSHATLEEETIRSVLLNDIEEGPQLDEYINRLDVKQAVEPFMAKASLSDGFFGLVPKVYIRSSRDRVMSPAHQDRMIRNWDVDRVFTLDTGHFPLLSRPDELGEVLLKITG